MKFWKQLNESLQIDAVDLWLKISAHCVLSISYKRRWWYYHWRFFYRLTVVNITFGFSFSFHGDFFQNCIVVSSFLLYSSLVEDFVLHLLNNFVVFSFDRESNLVCQDLIGLLTWLNMRSLSSTLPNFLFTLFPQSIKFVYAYKMVFIKLFR